MSVSILRNEKECYVCGGMRDLEQHHILSGTANRKLSEKYGCWVWLCHDHHTGPRGAQYDKALNLRLKQEAQQAFEALHGHEQWMQIFRKNYL